MGSINLAEFVKNPFTNNACVDFDVLEDCVAKSVVALNQVLLEGMKLHPLKEQQDSVYDWRQIGLGTMGLGDMLIKLGITYGSQESIYMINAIFKDIAKAAVLTSLQLAKNEGCYPMCNKQALRKSSFLNSIGLAEAELKEIEEYGLFNSQLLTCAPTGSIGTMLQISTGVEPNFAFEFNRRTVSLNKEETTYKVYAPIVNQYYEVHGVSKENSKLPEYFVASQDINPIDRIAVQATLQRYIDASISSTINLPEETTVETVFNIYFEAWRAGLKGVTIYRDNCQRQGILTKGDSKQETNVPAGLARGEVIKASDNCIGLKRTLVTGCGTLHCEAFFDPQTGDLREAYLSKGSKGGCNNFMIGLSRMISLAARGGLSIDAILDQLKSCGTCPSYAVRTATKHDTSRGSCCPVAVGNALRDIHNEVLKRIESCNPIEYPLTPEECNQYDDTYEECPKCHHKTLIHHGGCVSCTDCGWTKCD